MTYHPRFGGHLPTLVLFVLSTLAIGGGGSYRSYRGWGPYFTTQPTYAERALLIGAHLAVSKSISMAVPQLESEPPVLCYFVDTEIRLPREKGRAQVLISAWSDGRILWSEDRLRGGAPYYSATIDARSIESLIRRFESEGYFRDDGVSRIRTGPDATVSRIVVVSGTDVLTLASWHEIAETNLNLVATSVGLIALEGKTREEVLDREPEEYLRFRRAWGDVRSGLLGLIPPESGKRLDDVRVETRSISVKAHLSQENKD